jgi:hypothetical protein
VQEIPRIISGVVVWRAKRAGRDAVIEQSETQTRWTNNITTPKSEALALIQYSAISSDDALLLESYTGHHASGQMHYRDMDEPVTTNIWKAEAETYSKSGLSHEIFMGTFVEKGLWQEICLHFAWVI